MKAELQERIQKLQLIEENLHANMSQKQQVQAELLELESASQALEGAREAYSIIGNVMVRRPNKEIQEELRKREETVQRRLEALEKQESTLKKKAETLQQEIMKGMKEMK